MTSRFSLFEFSGWSQYTGRGGRWSDDDEEYEEVEDEYTRDGGEEEGEDDEEHETEDHTQEKVQAMR